MAEQCDSQIFISDKRKSNVGLRCTCQLPAGHSKHEQHYAALISTQENAAVLGSVRWDDFQASGRVVR